MKRSRLRPIVLIALLVALVGGLWIATAGWPPIVIRNRRYLELIAGYQRAQPRTKPHLSAWDFEVQVPNEYTVPTAHVASRAGGVVTVKYTDETDIRPLYRLVDYTSTAGIRTEGSLLYVHWVETMFRTNHWLLAYDLASRDVIARQRIDPNDLKETITAPSHVPTDSDRYAVYSALLRKVYIGDRVKLLVIHKDVRDYGRVKTDEETESTEVSIERHVIRHLPDLKQDTLDDYRVRKGDRQTLAEQFDIPVKYLLVTDKEIGPIFVKGSIDDEWQGFYSKYPKSAGIVSLSHIGFNGAMTQALVYTARSCGGRCGAGEYVLLGNENGIWSVKSTALVWVS